MWFTEMRWNFRAALGLRRALGADLDAVALEVMRGESQLWKVHGCGYLVTRVECYDSHRVLVLVAGEGCRGREVIEHMQHVAKESGCTSMRLHSQRQGMGRYLSGIDAEFEARSGDNEEIYEVKV